MSTSATRLFTLLTLAILPLAAPAEDPPKYQWTLGAPLLHLARTNSDEPQALLDPCAVLDGGKWHLFATGSGGTIYYALDNWQTDGKIQRGRKLPIGNAIVPQVFYFRPTKKWHLIGMLSDKSRAPRFMPCLSTNDKVDDPEEWTKPIVFDVPPPLDDKEKVANWMDFYVICDAEKAHLFATSAGRLWRSETKLADYPQGWSKPVVALNGNFIYASHTYGQETDGGGIRFITTITATHVDPATKKSHKFQQSYIADKLEGPWREEAIKADTPFAGIANIKLTDLRWNGDLVHGEPIRKGSDERMLLERDFAGFVFHGRAKLTNEDKAAAIDCVGVLERVGK